MELNFRKTYRAFTLWELIIAMLITSIIVTLSYGVYRKAADLLSRDLEKMEMLHDMVYIERDLLRLTESSESMELVDDILYFNYKNSYSYLAFSDSMMKMNMAHRPEEREIPIEAWSVKYLDNHSDYIKSFRIKCSDKNQSFIYTFGKTYPNSFHYSNNEE